MKKYKSLRNAIIALLIFGLLAFVCYGAVFAVLAIATRDTPFFTNHMVEIIYILGFQKQCYLLLSINSYLLILTVIILFVVMLTVSILKSKASTVLPWFLLAASYAGFVEIVANLSRYTAFDVSETGKTGYVALLESESLATKIMVLALIVLSVIAVLVSSAAFLTAFIYTLLQRKSKTVKVAKKKPTNKPNALPLAETNNAIEESMLQFEEEPEPEPEPEPVHEEQKDEKVELVELIRQIIREELGTARQANQPSNQSINGATFSSPLIVQYFNGLNNQPQKEEEKPTEEPKEEEVQEVQEESEPILEEQPVIEEEPAPVEEPLPEEPVMEEYAEEPVPEKKVIVRIPFQDRITTASEEMKKNYNEIKNYIMAYGVHYRVSNSGDTFRLHRKTFVKLTIAGKSLKLYFALNPADYMSSTFPIGNAGDKNIYAEIPLIFKVKSGLSVKRCKQLVDDVMSQNSLTQGEIGDTDWVDVIATMMTEGNIDNSDDDSEEEE